MLLLSPSSLTWVWASQLIPLQHLHPSQSASTALLHLNFGLESLMFNYILRKEDFNSDSTKYLLYAFKNCQRCEWIPSESDFLSLWSGCTEFICSGKAGFIFQLLGANLVMALKPFSTHTIPKIIVYKVIIFVITYVKEQIKGCTHITLRKLNVLDKSPNFRKADMSVFK